MSSPTHSSVPSVHCSSRGLHVVFRAFLLFSMAFFGPSGASAMIWTQASANVATDALVGSRFGWSVALEGNLAFVGAPYHDDPDPQTGRVYVYEIDPVLGTFTEIAQLLPTVTVKNDVFGRSIDVQGDVVVVGATEYPGGNYGAGFAMIFEKPAAGWSGVVHESATLLASNRGGGDQFGHTVVIQDSLIAVGAPGEDEVAAQAGAVYVYERPAGGWTGTVYEVAKLNPTTTSNTSLGRSLAISGDLIVSGGNLASIDGLTQTGCGFVFERPTAGWSGTLTETARLRPTNFGSSDRVGASIAIHGSTIAVGANLYEAPGLSNVNHGAIFVFEEPTGGWSGTVFDVARLEMSDKSSSSQLGTALAMDSDRIVATSAKKEAAYVFDAPTGGWSGVLTETTKVVALDAGNHEFGAAVALEGQRMLVGASLHDQALTDAGRAYLFVGEGITGIEDAIPSNRAVHLSARPNPFNPRTEIAFSLDVATQAGIEIYDARGRRVRSVAARRFEAGAHRVSFDGMDDRGRSLPSGVYFARFAAPEHAIATMKLTLVR